MQDLHDFGNGYARDHWRSARAAGNQAFRYQTRDGLPQGCAGYSKLLRKRSFLQVRSGCQLSPQDHLAETLERVFC
jgi:hypothetical protein